MNNKRNKTEGKRRITPAGLIRWAGLQAMLAGILYIVIQPIHPADELSSVNTDLWFIVACLTGAMSLSALIGLTGIYVRQAEEAGRLGLIGYLMFGLFWIISLIFSFIEAFVLPLLTDDAPRFVEGLTGLFGETESEADLGVFPTLAPLAGVLYIVGGLLLGMATFRAGVLSRPAAALLAAAAVLTVAGSIIPHPNDRILAVPMGAAFIWLGYALWSERKRSMAK